MVIPVDMGWIWVKRSRGEKLHRHGGCLARESETETQNVGIPVVGYPVWFPIPSSPIYYNTTWLLTSIRQLDWFGSHKQKTPLWRRCLRTPNTYYHKYRVLQCGGIHSNVTYTSNSSNNNVFFPCRHRKKLNTAMIDSFFDKLSLAFNPIRTKRFMFHNEWPGGGG